MKLSSRMMFQIGGLTLLIIGLITAVIAYALGNLVTARTLAHTKDIAKNEAKEIEAFLNGAMDISVDLANLSEAFLKTPEKIDRDVIDQIVITWAENFPKVNGAPKYLGVWLMNDPGKFDGRETENATKPGYDSSGGYAPYAFWEEGKINFSHGAYQEAVAKAYYSVPKSTNRPALMDAYIDPDANNALMCSTCVPIHNGEEAVGVAGVDIKLTGSDFVKRINEISPMGQGYAYLASSDAKFIVHRNGDLICKPLTDSGVSGEIVRAVSEGKEYEETGTEFFLKESCFTVLVPLTVGTAPTHWSLVTNVPMSVINQATRQATMRVLVVGLIGVLVMLAVVYVISKRIARSVASVAEPIRIIAQGEGDLTQRVAVTGSDEIADLARWFNEFVERIQIMFREIGGNASSLSKSSGMLHGLSDQVAQSARETSGSANDVAQAAREGSGHVASVAAGMDAASSNLTMVAAATEEMTATIGEIASQSEKARSIATEATQQAESILVMMRELGQAAQDIGSVTDTITAISSQTNLLALNATIEAARAGSAGKGFAVVANEIKELAQQTAAATEDIRARVASVQNSTNASVADVGKISEVIRGVHEIVTTIATAIEEQSVVTRDIAGNIGQASNGVTDANHRIAQVSEATHKIAQDVAAVNETANVLTASSDTLAGSAQELAALAAQLNALVNRFKVD